MLDVRFQGGDRTDLLILLNTSDMPTYLYGREDGSTFEIEQRITDPALTKCPTTGQVVKRLISKGAGLVFKGSGFYQTDYARAPVSGSSSSTAETVASASKSEKTESASSEASTNSKKDVSSPAKGSDSGSSTPKS